MSSGCVQQPSDSLPRPFLFLRWPNTLALALPPSRASALAASASSTTSRRLLPAAISSCTSTQPNANQCAPIHARAVPIIVASSLLSQTLHPPLLAPLPPLTPFAGTASSRPRSKIRMPSLNLCNRKTTRFASSCCNFSRSTAARRRHHPLDKQSPKPLIISTALPPARGYRGDAAGSAPSSTPQAASSIQRQRQRGAGEASAVSKPHSSLISSQRAMFDTFTRHAGSGLVHPTDAQIQRLLLREPSSRSSRPSSARRALPPHSAANLHSSEDDEFESFLSQQPHSAASGDSAANARARPTSALIQGRPG